MTTAHEYTITVRLVNEESQSVYRATVAEFPDVAYFGETYGDAYEGVIDAITTISETLSNNGQIVPTPLVDQEEFSGRVTLRISKSLHARLHAAASRESVSLNQWVAESVALRLDGGAKAPVSLSSTLRYLTTCMVGNSFAFGLGAAAEALTAKSHSKAQTFNIALPNMITATQLRIANG